MSFKSNPLFKEAICRFDEANSTDPNLDLEDGNEIPKELLYAHRLTDWVLKLQPEASECLRLAARSQHLCRWKIPRKNFPKNRAGYLKWRTRLYKFHAELAGEILQDVGYESEMINQVQTLLLKSALKTNPEAQLLEDAVCLVFLGYYFIDFVKGIEDEKLDNIIKKTWTKMSPTAQEIVGSLGLPELLMERIQKLVS